MFSITTIASSTTMPVARMIPKSVSVLIEKPISFTNANAPMSETGMVMAGMSVLRHVCRKTKITSTTRMIASTSVFSTSAIDASTTSVVLNETRYTIPGGKTAARRSSSAVTARSTSSELAAGSWVTPKPTASTPWKRRLAA